MTNILSITHSSDMLRASEPQVDAIRTAAGLTQPQFDGRCLPLLRAYANRVQNLPFSPTVFSRPRGAWECGLICAHVAYQYASSVIFFPDMGAEERRVLERQCRYMCFIATLAACVSLVTGAVKIVAGDEEYHPLITSAALNDWLHANPNAVFTWRMNSAPLSSQACAAIAARFVPAGLLEGFDLRAVMMVFDAIALNTKLIGVESTLGKVVRESIKRVLDHYSDKEATVFKSDPGAIVLDPQEAAAIAARITAHANPTLPVNPLATAAQPHVQTSPSAPAAAQSPTQAAAVPAQALHAATTPNTATPAPATVSPGMAEANLQQPAGTTNVELPDPLVGADQVLVEWFAALKRHPRYPDLAKQLVTTQEGVQVPINMLGLFGVSGPAIRKKMEEGGFVVRRSDDARGVILIPGLQRHFVATVADGTTAQT